MKRENFVRNLSLLTGDTVASLNRIIERNGGGKTGVFDPFDDVYRIVYQLTMRTVGATEIAESPELLSRTLGYFEDMEGAAGVARIAFPWLPTRGYLTQVIQGARLYAIFNKFATDRKKTGRREEDALQFLLDQEVDMVRVLSVGYTQRSCSKPPRAGCKSLTMARPPILNKQPPARGGRTLADTSSAL